MWQTDWATPPPDTSLLAATATKTAIDPGIVELAHLLYWEEHCVECALPDCYRVCPLYVPRQDQRCARFRYGIFPNPAFSGLYEFGADVHFRRWGKLESRLAFGTACPDEHRQLAVKDARTVGLLNVVNSIGGVLPGLATTRRLNHAYKRVRSEWLRRFSAGDVSFDEFVVEVCNPSHETSRLIVECVQEGRPSFRGLLTLAPGTNLFRIPFASLGIDLMAREGKILVYPDHDAEVRLIFTWLDFVKYRTTLDKATWRNPARVGLPAPRVKCVVWDLDNTLWEGTLVEDGPEQCRARPEALELIRHLDERGIIQTVVSKNDHAPAWALITKLDLQDYFVASAINWGQKSWNIRQLADDLNLNVDTFAVIDDSPFERTEIGQELPQVRTYHEREMTSLLDRPEFDVSATEEGKQRRLRYLAEGKRKEIVQIYGENYAEFIRQCRMEAELFIPGESEHIDRCLELLQRSNQLNLSTTRYEHEAFVALLADPEILSMALRCRDRFGDYGIVGFASVQLTGAEPVLKDLVISCRVAKKKVENAWFRWLTSALRTMGYTRLCARYVHTARNRVLLDALQEVGFEVVEKHAGLDVLELGLDRPVPDGDLVHVSDGGMELPTYSPSRPRGVSSG